MNNANPLMDICVVLVILFIIICSILLFHAYGKEDTNVSECFLKFKELGCSMVRPTEECKQYLHCLQKHNEMEDSNYEDEGTNYYRGIAVGLIGYIFKRYVLQRILD